MALDAERKWKKRFYIVWIAIAFFILVIFFVSYTSGSNIERKQND